MKSFESYRQLVILFWGPICIKNTFYVIACSIPFVLLLFWSVLFEKLDCKHLRGSHLLTFLWISGADLYVTSRWPDTSVFHSPIPALVPRPKFITPSWPKPNKNGHYLSPQWSSCWPKQPNLFPGSSEMCCEFQDGGCSNGPRYQQTPLSFRF